VKKQKQLSFFSVQFGFCDIQNNQGLGKGYQPQLATAGNPYLNLDYFGYHKNLIQ